MHQASGAGKRKSPKRSSLLTFVLIGDTGTRRMVLRLACARLHPPPRPPKGFYTHDIPTPPDGPAREGFAPPRRGASDSDRAIPSRGTKQSMTDVRVNQLSTSSVPSCLRALRVDRQDAFLSQSQ